MKIYEYSLGKTADLGPSVIALGFFDGVHLGHRTLLTKARELSIKLGVPFGVFTFDAQGPIKGGGERIYGNREKAELFSKLSADFTVICDFRSVSELSPERFVSEVLVGAFHAEAAVAGFNFRFGKGASGDAEALSELMEKEGKRAVICDDFTYGGETVSTTRIKSHLERGEIEKANALLGAPFRICGKVTKGNSVGHTLGFPTVNTAREQGLLLPKRGVYRSATVIDGRFYSALTNVGTCPTFEERLEHCETYILDFEGDLYGREITVYFLEYLREEKRFESEKELIMQINIDKNTIIERNGDAKWQGLGPNLQ